MNSVLLFRILFLRTIILFSVFGNDSLVIIKFVTTWRERIFAYYGEANDYQNFSIKLHKYAGQSIKKVDLFLSF